MERRTPATAPVAIVGIGFLHPRGGGVEALRRLIADVNPGFEPFPMNRFWRVADRVPGRLKDCQGVFFRDIGLDLRSVRIPKAYERAVSTLTLMLLRAARDCLADAGYDGVRRKIDGDSAEVIVGCCFGFDSTLTNALKVHGLDWLAGRDSGLVEAGRERLRARFGCSSHDRIGEMASAIAARIGAMHGWHGRLMAVENADATGYAALRTAALSLADGQSDAVLIATGQRYESALTPLILDIKGYAGIPLGEGATVLLLKRLADARRDGDRIHAIVAGMAARQTDSLQLRTGFDAKTLAATAADACAAAALHPDRVAAIECVLPVPGPAGGDVAAAFPGRTPTNASDALGYSFANAAATGLAAAALNRDPSASLVMGVSVTGLAWSVVLRHPDDPADAMDGGVSRPAEAAEAMPRILPQPAIAVGGAPDRSPPEPIAVVGMGGCFGPCVGLQAFRAALLTGADGIGRVSETVLPRALTFDPSSLRVLSCYSDQGAELASDWERRYFDARRLRLFPNRVAAMDVAQKLALAVATEALDDFGVDRCRDRLGRGLVVVATPLCLATERSLSNRLHALELVEALGMDDARVREVQKAVDEIGVLTLDNILAGNIAALISSCFRLGAETMVVEAACASSLAALHAGIQALRSGYADWVIAGGVELPVNQRDLVLCSSQRMLSQERISPFSEGADGFSPGDGAGMFVLRRLRDARRDGDRVLGSLIGVGASSDAMSMTSPDKAGQVLAMRRAFADAGVSPDSVSYVEAHGTGTRIGDRIEIDALSQVYGGGCRSAPLLVGSVKSNFGHTFAAAGAAGLMKTLLTLVEDVIPPTLLRREQNPDLPLAEIPARIAATPLPWPDPGGPRRAAVNSMGTGGVNFHLLIQSA